MLGLLISFALMAAASEARAAGWTAEPVPTQTAPEPVSATAVACPAANDCLAVGSVLDLLDDPTASLVVWNGSSWTAGPPLLPPGVHGQLNAIACPSASTCTAVGFYSNSSGTQLPLAASWNGSAWSVETVPLPAGTTTGQFTGVSCTSASFCQAVGAAGSAGMAERWNGSNWTVEPVAASPGAFAAVSCSSPTACSAVGGSPSGVSPFAEHWDGSAWTAEPLAQPSSANISALTSVSCPSDNSCFAAGTANDSSGDTLPLIEHWDGSSWQVSFNLPAGTRDAERLNAISCSSPSSCTAIGGFEISGEATVVQWNGTSWVLTRWPNPSIPILASRMIAGVSCSGPTACLAVGYQLALSWDGKTATWLDPVTQPVDAVGLSNGSVACGAPGRCVAVGYHGAPLGVTYGGLTAVHSQGATWTLDAPPLPSGTTGSALASASCAGPTFCLAVGEYNLADFSTHPLVERWDGSSWATQSAIDPPGPAGVYDNAFSGVSCVSPAFCVAVGDTGGPIAGQPLVEIWNGSTWAIVPAPAPPGGASASLRWVSCSSVTACTADGYSYGTSDTPFGVRWNGTTITLQAGAPGGPISCPTDNYCVAIPIGNDTVSVWSGGAWGPPMTLPDLPSIGGVATDDVSCSSPTACTVAAGEGTERWNGTAWSAQQTAAPPPGNTYFLDAVSCPTETDCTAVGSGSAPGSAYNLAEQYGSGGCAQPPVITQQPSSLTVNSGQPATLSAAASTPAGCGAPTVQWQASIDGGKTFADVPGAASATQTATLPDSASGDQFRAVFANAAGTSTTNAVTVTIVTPPPPFDLTGLLFALLLLLLLAAGL
jgi:hypothetical protein